MKRIFILASFVIQKKIAMFIFTRLLFKKIFPVAILLFCFTQLNAQIATYPLKSGGGNPPVGTALATGTNANVTASTISVGSEITTSPTGTFNSSGLRVRPNNLAWPTIPSNSFCVNVPLSPKAGYDFVLTSVTFKNNALDNTPNLFCQLAYQINGAGSWFYLGTPQAVTAANVGTTITIGGLNNGFYNNKLYVFRLFFYGNGANDKGQGFRMTDLVFNGNMVSPPAAVPTVHATSASPISTYAGTAQGNFDAGAGFQIADEAGFIYSTNTTPTLANSSIVYAASATSPLNEMISGLTPATTYSIKAFVIVQGDTILSSETVAITTYPYSVPLLNTISPLNVLSNKATTGGNFIDSGGYAVVEKGVLYAPNFSNLDYPYPNPPASPILKTSDGIGNADFASTLKNLIPSTKYYVMAYARNQLGVGYGALDSFVTGPPTPSIIATPGMLDFGDVTYNTPAPFLSYKLNATFLTPAAGTISLSLNNGYTVSATINGTYSSTLTLPYTGSTITNKIIYVKSPSTPYGPLAGRVLHSGGGAVTPDIDTVFLQTNVIQNQDTLSNMGTDFWAGFGCQEKMSQNTTWSDTTSSASGAHLTLYIATGNQSSTVVVEMPGITGAATFPRTLTIPANSVGIVNGFPIPANDPKNTSLVADSRLYYTGKSSRGIHIFSTNGAPVACWLYDWATNNSAGGSMLFPTNTWNSSYSVLAYGGDKSNTGDPSSYFFVIASQDSTPITFIPTADIIDSASSPIITGNQGGNVLYAKGGTYNVLLKKKGDVFNALGYINSTTGASQDLTGTKVSTTCDKKIAVFGGNSRTLITTTGCGSVNSGSDNLIQQMFPSVALGTRYLTVPTKTMEYNLFRVAVSDPATKVWVDNVLYTTASPRWNAAGSFYAIEGNQPKLVTSDKPVSVTQFILPGSYCGGATVGNNGTGDPEMILLSPIQQAITKATVYCPDFKDNPPSGGTYINVIIPKAGIDSFKIDNKNYAATVDTGNSSFTGAAYGSSGAVLLKNAFKKHPQDTSYYYAKLKVSYPASHTMSSNVAFNAIAYGTAKGESWGYNAGTAINNLSAVNVTINPNGTDTSTGPVKTVKNNLVYLQIAVPYDTTTINSIIWDPSGNVNVVPNTAQAGITNPSTSKPICLGTIIKDGRTFYIYQSPVQYKFLDDGAYKIKVTLSGTFVSDCGGTDIKTINVLVGHDDISFTTSRTPVGDCTSRLVVTGDNSTGFYGTTIKMWIWDFGDGSPKDTIKLGDPTAPNPKVNPHTFPANALYYVKLTTINSIGGATTDSVAVDLSFTLNTTFTQSQDTICPNGSVVFTPTSSPSATWWYWNYGDGSPLDSTTNSNPVSHQYTIEGLHTVSHWVKNSAGCPGTTVKDTVFVTHQPIADFVLPGGVCLPNGTTLFINTSDTAYLPSGMPYTYHWSFTGIPADTSDNKNPVFTYTHPPSGGGFPVSLTTTNRFGCVSTPKVQYVTSVYNTPVSAISGTSDSKICVGSNASFFDLSGGTGQTVNSWYWSFGDGGVDNVHQNPQHIYTTNKTYTVKLVIGTDKGCVSDTVTWTIKVNPNPVAGTILPSSCISSGSLLFQDNSTVAADASTQTPYTYTWNFGDGTGTFTTKDSTHTYAGVGTYYVNHSITTLNGCTDNKKDTFTISGSKPVPGFNIPNRFGLCSNVDVTLIDTSRVAIGAIQKVEIRWDAVNNYGAVQTDNSPSNGAAGSSKTYTHTYPRLPKNQTYSVILYAYSGSTCMDSIVRSITVYGSPKVVFDTLRGVCVNGGPRYIHLAHDSSGFWDISTPIPRVDYYYSGVSVVADTFYPATAGVGTFYIKAVYETRIPFTHCRDSAIAPITVWALPTPSFTTSTPLCEGTSVAFTDHSTAGAGSGYISSWSWNFGDASSGANNTATTQNPTHNYSTYNTYNVTLKATSDSGCSATTTPQTITIHPKPKVGFIVPPGVCSGTAVGFTDTSKIADNTESQFTHYWNFGDPASGALNTATGTPLVNTSHLYATPPTDSVRLIVKSIDGCKDSLVVKLSSVVFPQQAPVYTANGRTLGANDTVKVCLGDAISFKNLNTPSVNQAYWAFGDSAAVVNTGKTISHTYPNATIYTGKHYADDNNGCRTTTATFNVLIWSLPTPVIKVGNPTCEKNSVIFTDGSTAGAGSGNIKSWAWDFGDVLNNTSTTNPATHTYPTANNYNVTLTVTSDSGCKATSPVATVVNVHPNPTVKFGLPTAVCLPLAAQFTDSTIIADGSLPATYLWNFNDVASGINNMAIIPNPSHSFSVSNNYAVKLIVTSNNGCIDSATKVLAASAIHNQPIANYSVNTTSHDTPRVCIGTPIWFKDSSGGNTAKSYWVWGDAGNIIELGSPIQHVYSAGTYTGQHYIDDNFGCRSTTVSFLAMVDTFPYVEDGSKFILAGTSAMLSPTITGGNTYLWTPIVPFGSTKTYLDFNDVSTPICTPLIDSIVYRVDVTGDGVCPAKSLYYTVRTFSDPVIPNVFSPNGDGVNDYWDISSLQYFAGANVQVFNRYGQLVMTRLGYSTPWNGKDLNGQPLPVGTYYYIIQLGNGFQPRSGSITILR